jgi:hypothetical protein
MMPLPPRDVFAAAARRAVEEHDEWDSPHNFQTLHWDGERLHCHAYVCIMPDLHATQYPQVMAGTAREQQIKDPADPAYAYLLQIEAFGIPEPAPDAPLAERKHYDADRLGRTFHKRPDATEAAIAWCADIHGRLWCATKRRSEPGRIYEAFYPPGKAPGGQATQALLDVAYTTGVVAHGLPRRPEPWMN